jgi:transcriptional regulator with GAF, ATPase, and Fis domain
MNNNTPSVRSFAQLPTNPQFAALAAELLRHAAHAADAAVFLMNALPIVLAAAEGQFIALAVATAGQWTSRSEVGSRQPLPADLLADVLDSEEPSLRGDWVAVPFASRPGTAEALVLRRGSAASGQQAPHVLEALAPVLAEGLAAVARREADRDRIRRLETILDIAGQWNRTREVQPLLVQMAEAATRLLSADRASIFLWDRRAHTLVGRPALGVDGGELRIPDNRGIVGQVIQSGQPCGVDARDAEQVNRQVDAQLGYQTKTVLCVPLRSRSGELLGAFELLNKLAGTFTADDEAALGELAGHAAIALENAQDREELLSTSRQLSEQAADRVQMIGQSPAIEALRSIIRRVADTDLAVLILGENGTGKEVVAQSIHYTSRRRQKPFIAVNCAAIPDTLAESELFGHEKGAFTDAKEARQGKFELAANGTLFLDEIGDLSLGGQSKLLRVLEEKVLTRVGGSTPIHTDARLLAATNQNLADMVHEKRFRQDLYFRLNVVVLEIPPLRNRPDDILLLAEHFARDFCRKARRGMLDFSPAARERLRAHAWPGNVRELRNLMERLAYLSSADRIEPEDLVFILSPGRGAAAEPINQPLADATNQFQSDYIKRAIDQAEGNMSRAAEAMGLHRSNLYRKMRQLGMDVVGE